MILDKAGQKKRAEELNETLKTEMKVLSEQFPADKGGEDVILDKLAMSLSNCSFWVGAFINRLNKEGI